MKKQTPISLTNPILQKALDYVAQWQGENQKNVTAESPEYGCLKAVNALSKKMRVEVALKRAKAIEHYIGKLDLTENDALLEQLIDKLIFPTGDHGKSPRPFSEIESIFSNPQFGIVFTAHPTFAIQDPILEAIADLVLDSDAKGIISTPHQPQQPITLEQEFLQSEQAINHARLALRRALTHIIKSCAEHYPNHIRSFRPVIADLASWVGADLDGRNDINWKTSYLLRQQASENWLSSLAEEWLTLADELAPADLREPLTKIANILQTLAKERKDSELLTTPPNMEWLAELDQLIATCPLGAFLNRLLVERAMLACIGLGGSRLHVRLNATQLHNSLRYQLNLDGEPTDPALKRSALRKLVQIMEEVSPKTVDFNMIAREQNTARRLFMLVQKLGDVLDPISPIRILIAESETPFTVLAAIYLAKRYQIIDRVDISPLFETPSALEHGAEIIDQLLDIPAYKDTIINRGVLAVQTGFSDAGRHLGQVAAGLAFERFQIKLATIFEKHGLDKVQLILFNTHGESVGRGAHPESLQERFNYLLTPYAKSCFTNPIKAEVSFQGADGYLFFRKPALAYASLITGITNQLIPCSQSEPDPFYQDQDQSLDFFLTLQEFNRRLMESNDFGRLLFEFAPNLFYPTGSRPIKRQHEGGRMNDKLLPSQMRAIPQNAILLQLGWPATVLGGIGEAIARDPEWFMELKNNSSRLKQIWSMIRLSAATNDMDYLLAYIELYNPILWLRLAKSLPYKEQRAARYVAKLMDKMGFYAPASHIATLLGYDANRLTYFLAMEDSLDDSTDTIELRQQLHAMRIALMVRLFLHVPYLPEFSSNPEARVEDVMSLCLHLEIEQAAEILYRAFPKTQESEQASNADDVHDYAHERARLIEPVTDLYGHIRQISLHLAHLNKAIG